MSEYKKKLIQNLFKNITDNLEKNEDGTYIFKCLF